jgi:hypothetical protein
MIILGYVCLFSSSIDRGVVNTKTEKKMKCRSCNAEIIWVTMESGKKLPVDKDSIKKRLVISDDEKFGAMRKVGVAHFETCPNASQHRKRGK